ncbi:MAG TPA: hypothetical protein VFJ64_10245 [Solirubrobacterales bacterium]|nr:hypothetical protein [Solirubrobacterales bacterium]
MKRMRTLVLAAATAAALIAIAGVSTATASNTALCEQHEEPCAGANIYVGHFEALAENPTFLTNATSISCHKGRILGFALGLAIPQVTHLEALTFTEDCLTEGGSPCAVESTELGLLLILRIALNLASAKMDNTRVLVSCPMVMIHCIYEMSPVMHVSGSPNANSLAEIKAVELPLKQGEGMFCPAEPKFDAEYKVVEPDPIAITG